MVSTETVMLKQCSRGQEVLATSQKGHKHLLTYLFENQDLRNQEGFQSVLKLHSLSKVCHICNLLVVLSNSHVMFCFVTFQSPTKLTIILVLNQFVVCKIGILSIHICNEGSELILNYQVGQTHNLKLFRNFRRLHSIDPIPQTRNLLSARTSSILVGLQ